MDRPESARRTLTASHECPVQVNIFITKLNDDAVSQLIP